MSPTVRPATPDDIPRMIDLLLADAGERQAHDPILWALADDAPSRIETDLTTALRAEAQPFRQFWQVAQDGRRLCGVVHSMMLPVPPIYAGADGEPGLILPDSFAVPDAPDGTIDALIASADATLRAAGARVLLSSFVVGKTWETVLAGLGYDPLTLYFSRTGLGDAGMPPAVRPASAADVPAIVSRSAENREVLYRIDPFWAIHPEADSRFAAWMRRSLTLQDRDMMVVGPSDALAGYVIAQPASRLHFPPAHNMTGTGVIDDFYHPDLIDPLSLAHGGRDAATLLRAAEAAFARRGIDTAFVVCPAGWRSRVEMLRAAGYETAMVWSIKRARSATPGQPDAPPGAPPSRSPQQD